MFGTDKQGIRLTLTSICLCMVHLGTYLQQHEKEGCRYVLYLGSLSLYLASSLLLASSFWERLCLCIYVCSKLLWCIYACTIACMQILQIHPPDIAYAAACSVSVSNVNDDRPQHKRTCRQKAAVYVRDFVSPDQERVSTAPSYRSVYFLTHCVALDPDKLWCCQ